MNILLPIVKKRKTVVKGTCACILPMTVILPAGTVLQKKASIMDDVLL